ncbi:MAG: PaaI family thioesterase [Betaproteobacteria bacterium]|nr:PaaI family thioesterase [Betaproteobacteria bacterium]
MTDRQAAPPIPTGFRAVTIGGEFMHTVGPLYGLWDGRRVHLGFRVEERHANVAKACHGGMLTSFADMQMAVVTHYQWPGIAGHSFPTINLTTDFVAPVSMGVWLEGTADIIRATKSLVFIQGTATVDGATVLRFNGVYKIGPKRDYANPLDPFGLLHPSPSGRK